MINMYKQVSTLFTLKDSYNPFLCSCNEVFNLSNKQL